MSLRFDEEEIKCSELGEESSLPNILASLNIQNKTEFNLDEEDEIYEGYGKIDTVFPYREYNNYNRELKVKKFKTAILENENLKAVFLPELGGRLWRLIDKKRGKNLLYTNDVIQPANLATRNAWFSGGVEWNIGIIGHTPLTMEQMFTAKVEDEEGNEVLRMYEYERIRKVVYQMDFWLEEKGEFLNCRMRIVNDSVDVIPMYWWSNMAIPLFDEGRIVLPAKEAFTSDFSSVYKVQTPIVDGVDISKYSNIKNQVDYFFHIPKQSEKYIMHLNEEGYGLLHISSNRLQSRKLFVWGKNKGGKRWQEFLTKNAGEYIEIQAGLGKTQYGCIPMAPHTAWEWIEQYGPVSMGKEVVHCDFEMAEKIASRYVKSVFVKENLEKKLILKKGMAKKEGEIVLRGSGYAALENFCREKNNEKLLSPHLDYASDDKRQTQWKLFLEKDFLEEPGIGEVPADFTIDDIWFCKLRKAASDKKIRNWYVFYQLGLHFFYRKNYEEAKKAFQQSCNLKDNPWANHGLAVCAIRAGEKAEAVFFIQRAVKERKEDLSFVKETFCLLLNMQAYENLIQLYEELDEKIKVEGRIVFGYIQALTGVGEHERAMELLRADGGLVIPDIREGDTTMNCLWDTLCEALYPGESIEILNKLNFKALQ